MCYHCSGPFFHISTMTPKFLLLTQNFSLNSKCVYPTVCWTPPLQCLTDFSRSHLKSSESTPPTVLSVSVNATPFFCLPWPENLQSSKDFFSFCLPYPTPSRLTNPLASPFKVYLDFDHFCPPLATSWSKLLTISHLNYCRSPCFHSWSFIICFQHSSQSVL